MLTTGDFFHIRITVDEDSNGQDGHEIVNAYFDDIPSLEDMTEFIRQGHVGECDGSIEVIEHLAEYGFPVLDDGVTHITREIDGVTVRVAVIPVNVCLADEPEDEIVFKLPPDLTKSESTDTPV